MAAETSAVSLTSNFYLKNFYRYNRNAIKAADRKEYSTTELSYEDTRALKRAIAKLGDFEFDEFDNEENLRSTIQAFAETYNLTMESTSAKGTDTYRLNKQLKELTAKVVKAQKQINLKLKLLFRSFFCIFVFKKRNIYDIIKFRIDILWD